jgi:hypothetical protein
MEILLGVVIYLVMGYLSAHYVWEEDALGALVGPKNYVDQNLILLIPLYYIGACAIFVTWPLTAPAILIWRRFYKNG